MAKSAKEAQDLIRKAADEGRIVRADSTQVDGQKKTAAEFFDTVLDMGANDVFVSDLSRLSDFSGCLLESDDSEDYEDYCNRWDKFIEEKVAAAYGIKVKANDYLVYIFSLIEAARNKTIN